MYIDLKFSMSQVTMTLIFTLIQDVSLNQNIRLTKAVMLAQIQRLPSTEQFVFFSCDNGFTIVPLSFHTFWSGTRIVITANIQASMEMASRISASKWSDIALKSLNG